MEIEFHFSFVLFFFFMNFLRETIWKVEFVAELSFVVWFIFVYCIVLINMIYFFPGFGYGHPNGLHPFMLNPGWLDVAYMNYVFPDCFRQQQHNPQFPKGKYWFYLSPLANYCTIFSAWTAHRIIFYAFQMREEKNSIKCIDELNVKMTNTKQPKIGKKLLSLFYTIFLFHASTRFILLVLNRCTHDVLRI